MSSYTSHTDPAAIAAFCAAQLRALAPAENARWVEEAEWLRLYAIFGGGALDLGGKLTPTSEDVTVVSGQAPHGMAA
jgi:hypothetical protein